MKTPDWAKQAIVTVVFVGGLLAWFAFYHVPALIDSQTKNMSSDVSSLKTATGDLKGDIQRIDTTVNGMMKELLDAQLSSLKGIKNQSTQVAKERLTFVAKMVGKAKQAGILVDPAVVTDAGRNVLELAHDSKLGPAAWTATQQLLDYQSFLTPKPLLQEPAKSGPLSRMWSTGVLPFTVTSLTVYSWTSNSADMASFEPLNGDRNGGVTNGPALISLNGDGGDLQIDEHRAKNVIFNHLHIIYRGGRLDLSGVYFSNCTFDISAGLPRTLLFARALFLSSPANFIS